MEQVYIIGKTNSNGQTEFLDYVFKEYAESRKVARKLIEKHNKNAIYMSLIHSSDENATMLREITPDVWTCSELTITIEVLAVKALMKKRKMAPRIIKESLDKFVESEILM